MAQITYEAPPPMQVEVVNPEDIAFPGGSTLSTVQATNTDVDSGAAEALSGSSKPCTGPCFVKAFYNNTGIIYVSFDGSAASSTNGVQLGPGEQCVGYVANLDDISVRASVDNQGVSAHAPG